ncbi:Medium-chain fatty-acid--CoA ligase [Sinobacterium norvegicum]|uniref:Medium-chain fatty-acid--CoA ligase n=1 Tax=Sinobacterium norvegicum TaxID=1641715 RepID=A0ABM9AIQ8_9GAMM|nr:AMP-binding protein [Sinobacterium norvegicum]CAH0993078.1 Medium-chain fatty-acid--CoA ligase [Sinobacterium norvegicum]
MKSPLSQTRIDRDSQSWLNMTIAEGAWQKAEQTPDDVAIFLEHDPSITYGSIATDARRLITGLRKLGMQQGDVVSFQLPNWREAVILDIASSALGLIVNPVIPIYRDRELRFILKDANTKLIFIPEKIRSAEFPNMLATLQADLPALEHIVTVRAEQDYDGMVRFEDLMDNDLAELASLPKVDPNSIKTILYTSGTTGTPKAVLHSHNTLSRVIMNSVDYWQLGADDIMLMPSPVTHITGYGSGMVLPFVTPVKSALMARWDADAAVAFIERVGATTSVGATPFLVELLASATRNKTKLPTMRYFACGGAAVPPQLIHECYEVLENCKAFRVYGSTETPVITQGFVGDNQQDLAAQTDGMIYGYEVKIIDDNGNEVADGEDGEIIARGAGMMLGYSVASQNEAELDKDGFFYTGDIGHRTPDNAILITDRKKDIIIRGGENLSAKEIEDVLHDHPDVKEVAIVAMPHQRLGEGVCAYIIPEAGVETITLATIAQFADRAALAKQKIPEHIEVVSDLPRTASGKVKKDQLRIKIKEALAASEG